MKGVYTGLKMRFRRLAALLTAAVSVLSLAGCFANVPDDLYTLPQLSDEYIQLQKHLDAVLATGAEYSAPVSGSHRQAVQLEDLDGDGSKEALAFFRAEEDAKPLKIYIFRNRGGVYSQAAFIEGDGTVTESAAYADIDGDGYKELMWGRQISTGVKILSAYTLRDYDASAILTTDYTKYEVYDATGDGVNDFAVLISGTSETAASAKLYTVDGGGLTVMNAELSEGTGSIISASAGVMAGGGRGLFADSEINGVQKVTDVLTYKNGEFLNVSANTADGVSGDTVREITSVSCRDIDGDGVTEVPCQVLLPTRSWLENFWATEWYSYTRGGAEIFKLTTFHNISDSWYFVMPQEWDGLISVRRDDTVSGEKAIVFSELSAGMSAVDILGIYVLTGQGREVRAVKEGRFEIARTSDTIYAAEIFDEQRSRLLVSEEYVKENFSIIYSEWITE